jgi:hypothetical protein
MTPCQQPSPIHHTWADIVWSHPFGGSIVILTGLVLTCIGVVAVAEAFSRLIARSQRRQPPEPHNGASNQ